MQTWEAVVVVAAGVWAGVINTVVGSGTLVTFPILVALGYPPVTATTSNAIGLISGSITGAIGYRHDLEGQGTRVIQYAIVSAVGALGGAALLLLLPADAFELLVPALVGLAVVLVAVQPALAKRLARRPGADQRSSFVILPLIGLIGMYGGYFTASQGIVFVGAMGLVMSDPLRRLNAFKNALMAVVNVVAGIVYALVAPVSWPIVGLLAIGSVAGGLLGVRVGRRLSPAVLRIAIVIIGTAAIVVLLAR
ncbi:sulfite exporter TauE/SafE family protein [Pseudonocardia parietis]|uniref:Probable membrane transporter protein n=1 Tax=Pseudonocardia parietis TaxID=570936 RepID=A0ABS4VU89_9PSEU|nr:sulfite exporter TauE/SafE family protein [Pseudonocardia parietis]MBP2367474.1 putative membrane protein YfcA [Pseudonocardia parietis]